MTTDLTVLGSQMSQQFFSCEIIDIPAGSFPKLVTVRLPTIDGAAAQARWFGTTFLEVGDTVICRRDTTDNDVLIIEHPGDRADNIFDTIRFNTNPIGLSHIEGQVAWNPVEKTIDVYSGYDDVVLQVGHETHILVYNDSGAPLLNGKAVHPLGVFSGVPSVEYALADTFEDFALDVVITTMDIPDGEFGIATKFGAVRSLDTTGWIAGQGLFVSPITPGDLTVIEPQFRDFRVVVGGVTVVDAVDGEIFVDMQPNVFDVLSNAWVGTVLETFDLALTSDGVTVTATLTADDGGSTLTLVLLDGFSLLSVPVDVVVTPGTDTDPTLNLIYIPYSTEILTATTGSLPASDYIFIAKTFIPSAIRIQTDGAQINQNSNDHLINGGGRGHIAHFGEKMRELPADYISGIGYTVTIDSVPTPDDVFVAVDAGVIKQVHNFVFSAIDLDAGGFAYVFNHTTAYFRITNLNVLTTDALGVSLANRSFKIVLFAYQNRNNSGILFSLPTGSYHKNAPDQAVADPQGFTVYSAPQEYGSTIILVAEFTFTLDAGGNTWVLFASKNLRGRKADSLVGGAGGTGVQTFTQLTDTPSTLAGEAGVSVIVNQAESALEFYGWTADSAGNLKFIGDNVGIGLVDFTPVGRLHVMLGPSGGTVDVSHREVVIENAGNVGWTMLTGNTSTAAMAFARPSNSLAAIFQYLHSIDQFRFVIGTGTAFAIGSVASAVNHLELTNAATGNGPGLAAVGETNVDFNLAAAGTGELIFTSGAASGTLVINNTAADGDPEIAFALSGVKTAVIGIDDTDDFLKIGTTAVATGVAATFDMAQGFMGLGTEAPERIFHVSATEAVAMKFESDNAAGAFFDILSSVDQDTGIRFADSSLIASGRWVIGVDWGTTGDFHFLYNVSTLLGDAKLTIEQSGRVGVGIELSLAQLHVDQISDTADIPVLYLDQADLNKEIIWNRGESSASTADQTFVDATDFTTPGVLLGWTKEKIDDQRVGGLGTIDVWRPFHAIPTA